METNVIDNYISITKDATNWVSSFLSNTLMETPYAPTYVERGRELMSMVSRLNVENLKEYIFTNSDVDSFAKWVRCYRDRLEREHTFVIYDMNDFCLTDMSLNRNNKFYNKINSAINAGFLSRKLAEDIPSIIYNIVTCVNKNTDSLMQCLNTLYSHANPETSKDLQNDNKTNLPVGLGTEKAKEVLQRAINANILDGGFQCLGLTNYQKRRFAELASEELGIKSKWKTFENLWNIKGLSKVKQYEANQDSLKIIDNLFSKEVIDKARIKK